MDGWMEEMVVQEGLLWTNALTHPGQKEVLAFCFEDVQTLTQVASSLRN